VGETGVHLVATWAHIEDVLQREEDFSANLTGVLTRSDDGELGTFQIPGDGGSQVIATADEPRHAVHRSAVQPNLSAKRVASLEPLLSKFTDEALRPWLENGGGDFAPISEVIPARAVAHVLGLPDGDVSWHRTWAMMGGDILAGAVSGERLFKLATESGQMATYLGEHLDAVELDGVPDTDAPMLHALSYALSNGAIDRNEAIGIAIVMFGAGGESTAALIGSTVLRLAKSPELANTLRNNLDLIPRYIEEVARLDPPFKFHFRAVRRECELGGFEFVPGDRLMLLWASANRDPAQFDDPDTFNLDRRHSKNHMSFGRGGHFCIGAPLARLEARLVLEQLLERTREFSLPLGERATYAKSIFIRRLSRLPVEVVTR